MPSSKTTHKQHYIYLLRHKGEAFKDYVKIGHTTSIERRIKDLQTASPTGVEAIAIFKTTRAKVLEKHLHNKFRDKQSNLEWFKLTHEDIVEVLFYIEEILLKEQNYVDKVNL